jgi:BMFP domain-containing protein YqiC
MVTRDEFDAQARVLERSRELIEALEKRVAQLEAQQGPVPAGPAEPPLPQD